MFRPPFPFTKNPPRAVPPTTVVEAVMASRIFFGDVGVLHEVSLCGLAPLTYELAVIGNPRALLFEYLLLYAQID